MAELFSAAPGSRHGIRSKKLSTRIDLTPMVDLGFLLITFFMLTTTLTKPKTMRLTMPAKGPEMPVRNSLSLTILLDQAGRLYYYEGTEDPVHPPRLIRSSYAEHDIGQVIRDKQRKVAMLTGDPLRTIVLIKPSDGADYEQVVEILDEMNINHVTRYSLVDISALEKQWLQQAQ